MPMASAPPCCRGAGGEGRQPGAQQASSDPPHSLAEHQGPWGEPEVAQSQLEKLYGKTGPASDPVALQQEDFLLMVPPTQTFRRNLKVLHSDNAAGRAA